MLRSKTAHCAWGAVLAAALSFAAAVILHRDGRKKEAKAIQKRSDEIMAQYPTASSGGDTINVAALR
jgi:hypothetical protein